MWFILVTVSFVVRILFSISSGTYFNFSHTLLGTFLRLYRYEYFYEALAMVVNTTMSFVYLNLLFTTTSMIIVTDY